MDRSLALSRIRRLDEMTYAMDKWLVEKTQSNLNTDQLFEVRETVSFLSTTAFNKCHKDDRRKIESAVAKRLSRPRQKKELTVVILVHMRDAIVKSADKQRKSLETITVQQIEGGQWTNRLKTIPSSLLIFGIVPFLQHPVENPPALSYAFDLCDGNSADAFAEAYVGSRSRAAARFQALKSLTVIPTFVNNEAVRLLKRSQKTLKMLARAETSTSSYFALYNTDNERLIKLLQNSSQGNFKTFNELSHAANAFSFDQTWCTAFETMNTKTLTEDQERCLTGTIKPIICLFKEMQKMKNEHAFRSTSLDLCAESPTIVKLPERIFLRSLVPYLSKCDLRSLKRVRKGFYHTLPIPHCTHHGSGSTCSLTAFFYKYKGAAFNGKKEKEYAEGFLEAFNKMVPENQKAFIKMLWVAGGHKPKNAEGESFAERTLGKKQHTFADRIALSRANDMMSSRKKLIEFANSFDELGVDDAEMATIRADYDKLPIHVRAWVEKLACIFYTGNIPPRTVVVGGPAGGAVVNSPVFTGRGNHAKAYALACRLLADGNFELLPKAARDEMDGLLQVLRGLHAADNLNFGSATAAYTASIKHEKAKNLLIKAVEALENCPGNGERYMQNAARNPGNVHVPFNPVRFAGLVQALTQFNTPIFRPA
jgi:hypothetical protein